MRIIYRFKKPFLALLLLAVLFAAFSVPVFAEDGEIDGLLRDFDELISETEGASSDPDDVLRGVGFDSLMSELLSALRSSGAVISFVTLLIGVSLGFILCEASCNPSSELHEHALSSLSLISSVLIFSSLFPLVDSVADALSSLSSFFSGLIPIAGGIIAAGGAVGTAGVQMMNMNIALTVVGKISTELLFPSVILMFSLSLVSSVDRDGMIRSVASGVRSFFFSVIGIVTTVILASVSLQSVISSASDSAALRAAKYAAGSAIPIVGSTVSGALSALFASASAAGAGIGVGSVAVVISMALSPLVLLLAHRLAASLFSSVLDSLGSSVGSRLIASFRSSLDALTAIYATSVLIYLFELIVFVKCGVRAFG